MPIELPAGISEEDVLRHQRRKEEIARAQSVPLPGPLLGSIEPSSKIVCGFALRPCVLADIAFLQRIGSPLLKLAESVAKAELAEGNGSTLQDSITKALLEPGETEFGAMARLSEAFVQSFFVFTKPPKEIRSILSKGVEHFREMALEQVADRIGPQELAKIPIAVIQHFSEAFSTSVGYTADMPEGEGSFTPPQAS